MSRQSPKPTNLEALQRFWHRAPFHDDVIQDVCAKNKRVLIRLTNLTLVIVGATNLTRCQLPAVWLRESLMPERNRFCLNVETETGHLRVTGIDVRLLRNDDLALLIPPIDV